MMILDAHIIEPQAAHTSSIIWLHGLGADGHDFASLAPMLNLSTVRFIFPHAPIRPVTVNNGYSMRAWYDIMTLDRENFIHDVEGVKASSAFVHELIEVEHQKGIAYERIVLAGFSQGGAIALFSGLTFSQPLAGILALSTYVPAPEVLQSEANKIPRKILMLHGDADDIVPLASGQASYELLKKMGQQPQFKIYKMAHSLCNEEVADIALWLKKILI